MIDNCSGRRYRTIQEAWVQLAVGQKTFTFGMYLCIYSVCLYLCVCKNLQEKHVCTCIHVYSIGKNYDVWNDI